jgi:hypothetical protein
VKTNKGGIINEEQVEIGPQALERTRPAPFFILVGDWLHRSKIFPFQGQLGEVQANCNVAHKMTSHQTNKMDK